MADARVVVDAILNASGVTKGVSQIKGEVNGLSWKNLEKGDSVASKVAGGLKTAGAAIGKALVAGTAAAATGVAAIGKAALESYATYEQLVGGVETLFGTRGAQSIQEYAEIVGKSVEEVGDEYASHQRAQEQAMQNASQAFKTAGMSANEYMEQTTSFAASLVSSLGGDTEKAVAYADMAVTDMADNANKMGTDIGRITDAYQGFAKQNYTMLDNLKLGYGGTKTEMERLLKDAEAIKAKQGEVAEYSVDSYADIVEAIHVVQEEMGITGTTQKEAAETIEGSINMTKAAYANWLTGLADDNADFGQLTQDLIESALAAFNNIMPRLQVVASTLIASLPSLFQTATSMIGQLLPSLIDAAVNAVVALIDTVTDMLANADFTAAGQSIGQKVVEIFSKIAPALLRLLPQLVAAGGQLMAGVVQGIVESIPGAADVVAGAVDVFGPALQNLAGFFEHVAQSAGPLLAQAIAIVQPALESLGAAFGAIMSAIAPVVEFLTGLLAPAFDIVGSVILAVLEVVSAFVQGIASAIETAAGAIGGFIDFVSPVGDLITGAFTGVGDFISGQFEFGQAEGELDSLEQKAEDTADKSASAFDGIGSDVSGEFKFDGAEASLSKLQTKASTTADGSEQAFTGIGPDISTQFEFGGAESSLSQLQSTSESTQSGITGAFDGIGGQVSSEFDLSGAEASLAQLGQAGGETPPQIADSFSSGAGQMDGAAQQFFKPLPEAATQAGNQAKSQAQAAVSAIVSVFSSGAGQMQGIGAQMAQGIASGIRNNSGAIQAAARDAVNAAVEAARAAGDIHSPSKKMAEKVGKPLAQGAAKGVTANKDLLTQAIKGMMEDTTKKTQKQIVKSANSLASNVTSAYKKLTAAGYESYEEFAKDQKKWAKELKKGTSNWDKSTKKAYKSFKKLEKSIKASATNIKKYWDLAAVSLDMSSATKETAKNTKTLTSLYKRTGLAFSESFVDKFMNGSEEYQKVFKDMANMTDGQVAAILASFDDMERAERDQELSARELSIQYQERMFEVGKSAQDAALDAKEAALDIREAVLNVKKDLADTTKNTNAKTAAIQNMYKRTGIVFTESFVKKFLEGSDDYEKALVGMASMTDAQVKAIVASYTNMERAERREALAEREWALKAKESMNTVAKSAEDMALDMQEAVMDVREVLVGNASLSSALAAAGVSAEDLARMVGNLDVTIEDFEAGVASAVKTVSDGFSAMARDSQTSLDGWKNNLVNNINEANAYARNLAVVMNNIPDDIDSEAFRQAVYEGGYDKWGQVIADLATKSGEDIAAAIKLYNDSVEAGQQAAITAFESLALEPPELEDFTELATATSEAMYDIEKAAETMENTVGQAFAKAYQQIDDSMTQAIASVQRGADEMSNIMKNADLAFPHVKIPHFSVRGSFSLDPISVPTFSVNWYATGGIFNGPSVIGVGERGAEMVLPSTGPMMDSFAERVAEKVGGTGATVTVYIDRFENNTDEDIDELADRVADAVDRKIAEKSRIKAYA